MDEEKKGKVNIILIVIIVLLLGLCGYFAYDKFLAKNNDNKINENDNSEKILKVYGYTSGKDTYVCSGQGGICSKEVYKIEVQDDNAAVLNVGTYDSTSPTLDNESSYILYFDNGIKIYRLVSKKIEKIDTPSISNANLYKYIIEYWNESNYLNGGFIFSYEESLINNQGDYSEYFYYDIKNSKKEFSDYTKLSAVSIDNYSYNGEKSTIYLQGNKDNQSILLEIATGKEIIKRDDDFVNCQYILHIDCNEKFLVYAFDAGADGTKFNKTLYDIDGKILRNIKSEEEVKFNNCQFGGKVEVYKEQIVDSY